MPLPGVCQVWWARPVDVRPEHDALLGEADLVRRARLASPADRQRLTAGAAVARLVLGAALGTPPAALRIDRTCPACGGPHGRPRLADTEGLHFSISHAGHCVAVAVLPGGPVGVDVEADGRSAPGQPRASTAARARREAVLRATGEGVGIPADGLVGTPPSTPLRLLGRDGPEAVWLRDLPAPAGFVAALAGVGTAPDDVVRRDAGPLLRQSSRRLSGPTTRSQRYP
ncbi:4'-phosphopantetheinyl transferase family protein [Geodermatophilus sp. SYSU D01176]